jgi:hypothetical protein
MLLVAKIRRKDMLFRSRAFRAAATFSPRTLSTEARVDLEPSKLFATRGRKAEMALALQVVSSHLLGVLDIENVLSAQPAFAASLCPHASSEAEALKRSDFPRLFLLDACSLTFPLGPLSSRLRANAPGSKFLALLAPDRSGEAEMIRTHLINASAESGSRQGEAFRESFQRDAHTARPGAESSATKQIIFRFSSADGIASNNVRLVF